MERTTEWDAKRLANCIDHTYLKPDATKAIIDKLCDEAVQYGFYSVCVNGMWVARCRERLAGKPPLIAAVTGFPLGSMSAEALAYETAKASRLR
jgi:deoxyribose-phosphate aldolase